MSNATPTNLLVAAIIVGVTAIAATSMLLWAAVMWLASLVGSLPLALLAMGFTLATVSYATYRLSLRAYFRELRNQYVAICELFSRARAAMSWVHALWKMGAR